MTTTQTTNPTDSTLIIAGAAADGHGALAGWHGAGRLERAAILAALAEAGLPESWAPRSKSAVGHAGAVVDRCSHQGLIARRARAAAWGRDLAGARRRDYAARWVVAVSRAAQAGEVGASVGDVVLVAELRDASDELHVTHADHPDFAALADRVRAEYRAARDAESYDSHDVTDWLRSVLVQRCGAARFGTGLYVPAAGRDVAERLCAALATRWGCDWVSPLLPVATSAQLASGLARGVLADVARVENELESERADARRKGRSEVSPTCAARLRGLAFAVADRADRLGPLCGADAMSPVRERLETLCRTLDALAGAAEQRFALIELDGDVARPAPAPTEAEGRAAVAAALAERRAEIGLSALPEAAPEEVLGDDWTPPGMRLSRRDYLVSSGADPDLGARPAPAALTRALIGLTKSLNPASDAGRLIRRVIRELADGALDEQGARDRLAAMRDGLDARWAPVAGHVLALLDAPATAASAA